MKDTEDKPEKPTGETARGPKGQTVSPVRSAKRTLAPRRVRRAAKKLNTPREDEEEVSPEPQTERPAADAVLVEHDVWHHAANLNPNIERLGTDLNTSDLMGGDLTMQEAALEEYFPQSISFSYLETLSEYFAEEEAEAAMLEADLAMSTDESAFVCDTALELVELAQEEVSGKWRQESSNF